MTEFKLKKLLILHTDHDPGALRIESGATSLGLEVTRIQYEYLNTQPLETLYQLRITPQTLIIPRSPFDPHNPGINYSTILKIITTLNSNSTIVDYGLLSRYSFHQYGDKLFHNFIFDELDIPRPEIFSISSLPLKSQFPLIAKQRIGARGKANFVLYTQQHYQEFTLQNNPKDFILQKYIPLISDYRVVMIKDQIISTVKRKVNVKPDRTIGVTVVNEESLPKYVQNLCLKLHKHLKFDFCGIDIGQTENNSYFFIEYNVSPQFSGVERESSINVAQKLLDCFIK